VKNKAEVMRSFGRALREARIAADFSQEGLALDSDVDRSYVSLLERGVRQPTLIMIHALAKTLKVRPHELVKRAEEAPAGAAHGSRTRVRRRK
jgi:transcriptional regulator with XRE-family HTH domain